ncbi:MAG: hypothetical protein QXO50_02575 [Candidatus Bathyarchaeia archaeon]
MILLTTSRRPTRRIRTFCKELSYNIPSITRINRGKLSFEGLASKALELNAEKILIVDRWKGGPGKIELFKLENGKLQPISPLIYLRGVKLRREFGTMPRGRRIKSTAILVSSKSSQEIVKLEKSFSEFFNLPLVQSLENCKNYNALLQTGINEAGEIVVTFRLLPENVEIGPRMRISHLTWDLIHEG